MKLCGATALVQLGRFLGVEERVPTRQPRETLASAGFSIARFANPRTATTTRLATIEL